MDKDLITAFTNISTRFNNQDERFNQICTKIDNYHGRKRNEIITALIGSPVVTAIVVVFLTIQ